MFLSPDTKDAQLTEISYEIIESENLRMILLEGTVKLIHLLPLAIGRATFH